MIIAVDFDGTIVTHEYPKIGEPVENALGMLHLFNKLDHKIILWTMRSGVQLCEAVQYLEDNGVNLWGVNENPEQKSWTNSPKQYAQMYIDDAALGCPLIHPDKEDGRRPYVNWMAVGQLMFGERFSITSNR